MVDGYWYSMDLVFRLPIFCLGLLLGFYVLEDRRLGTRDILFWCVWLGLGVLYLLTMGKGPNADYRQLCYLFLFTTVPMCFAICWCFERLPLGWAQRFFRLLGRHSLEIYLLNVSLFSEVTLLRRFVSFGPSNRLYFLLSYAANIALAVALHRLVELWKKTRETA